MSPSLKQWKSIIGKDYHGQLERGEAAARNRNSSTSSNLERGTRNKSMGKKEVPRFLGPVRIRIITVRKVAPRDAGAISEKAIIDSLVSANVLPDDNSKIIPERPEVSCVVGMPEITRIEIEEI